MIHAPRVRNYSTSRSPFYSLILELSFLTAERRIDTSEEEGSSSIGYREAFSVDLNNAMTGRRRFSYPFKDSFITGLAQVAMIHTYDRIGPACATLWDFCIETK